MHYVEPPREEFGRTPAATATSRTSPHSTRASSVALARNSVVSLEIISDLERFDALRTEWDALVNRNYTQRLAFQSHAWLRTWLEAFENPDHMHKSVAIVTARTNGVLRMVCPLAIRQVFGMTHLCWLGEPASQYGDVITDGTAASSAVIEAAMSFAIKRLQPDLVHLRKVREDAAVIPWFDSVNATATVPEAAPYLDFRNATTYEDYCAKFSSKSRKNRRRLRRRLEETGPVTTKVLPCGDAAREAVLTGLTFKKQWLVDRGHVSSALRDQSMAAFLAGVASQPDRTATPFVSIMRCGDKPVSVQFGVIAKRRLALHMIAYNPKTEKSGAGVLHIEDTIEHCINRGLTELDFLAPNAAYKQDWTDGAVPVSDYVVARTVRGRLYAQGYLCSTRNMLKTRVGTLPLSFRKNIAKRMQK